MVELIDFERAQLLSKPSFSFFVKHFSNCFFILSNLLSIKFKSSGFTAVLKLCLLFIKNKNIILVPLIYLNMHAWSLLELFIFGVSK